MYRILCYGDSNTWGYNAETGDRFPDNVRWTGVLQNLLGPAFRVLEEGQPGRTTVWDDPIEEHRNGKTALYSTLECQSPVDLVILMLGTNDLKPRFSLNAFDIAAGAERLIRIIRTHLPDGQKQPPRILLVCPPPIGDAVDSGAIGGMFTAAHSTHQLTGTTGIPNNISLSLPTNPGNPSARNLQTYFLYYISFYDVRRKDRSLTGTQSYG